VQAVLGPPRCSTAPPCCAGSRARSRRGPQLTQLERGLRRLCSEPGGLTAGLSPERPGATSSSNGLGAGRAGLGALAPGTSAAAHRPSALATASARPGPGATARAALEADEVERTRLETRCRRLTDVARRRRTALGHEAHQPARTAQSSVQSALRNLGSASPAAAPTRPSRVRSRTSRPRSRSSRRLRSNLATTRPSSTPTPSRRGQILRASERLGNALARISGGHSARYAASPERPRAPRSWPDGRGSSNRHLGARRGINQLLGGMAAAPAGSRQDSTTRSRAAAHRPRPRSACSTASVAVARRATRRPRALRGRARASRQASTSGYFVLPASRERSRHAVQRTDSRSTTRAAGNTARVIVVPDGGAFRQEDAGACRPASRRRLDDSRRARIRGLRPIRRRPGRLA
jgi:hypothetical protein